jgi:hypothetical protein
MRHHRLLSPKAAFWLARSLALPFFLLDFLSAVCAFAGLKYEGYYEIENNQISNFDKSKRERESEQETASKIERRGIQ